MKGIGQLLGSTGLVGAWSILSMGLTIASLYATGRLAAPARPRWESPLLGWALLYLTSILAALIGFADLRLLLAILAALTVVAAILRRSEYREPWSALFGIGLVALLFLSVWTRPVYWDSYAHWLPNSAYLFQLDRFPRSPLQGFPSLHPTYPPALPLLIYVGSRLTGHFAELGANVLNVLLSMGVMVSVTHLLRQSQVFAGTADVTAPWYRYGIPLLAFCLVVPLNPAIELQHYWSVIADPVLGVVIFIAVVTWCELMGGARDGERGLSAAAALFLLGVLIGGLKPGGWMLCFILSVAGGSVAIRHGIAVKHWLAQALALTAGGLIASLLWKLYLSADLPIADQFSIRPIHAWRFDLTREMLSSVLYDFRVHWIYWLYVGSTVAVGLASLIRRSTIGDPTLRLILGITSIAMLLHLGSLLAAYLGTGFQELEIKEAACFQRYTSEVGYSVCMAGLVALARELLVRSSRRLRFLTIRQMTGWGVAVCAVLFFTLTVRPTFTLAERTQYAAGQRKLALEALKLIPGGNRVAVVGDRWSINFLRYESWVDLPAEQRPRLADRHETVRAETEESARALLRRWTSDPNIDSILVLDAAQFAHQSGLSSAPDQIWRREDHTWRKIGLDSDQAPTTGLR